MFCFCRLPPPSQRLTAVNLGPWWSLTKKITASKTRQKAYARTKRFSATGNSKDTQCRCAISHSTSLQSTSSSQWHIQAIDAAYKEECQEVFSILAEPSTWPKPEMPLVFPSRQFRLHVSLSVFLKPYANFSTSPGNGGAEVRLFVIFPSFPFIETRAMPSFT